MGGSPGWSIQLVAKTGLDRKLKIPHFEEALHSWMVRGAGASTSGEPAADSWKSFDERVLLEPMPDSSASSVNGPSHTEAVDSAQTSVDPNLDPEELF